MFEVWATAHNQLEHFEYGEFNAVSISKDYNYPAMIVEQSDSGRSEVTFDIYFFELWDSGKDNTLLDAFNETNNIMNDFMSWAEKEFNTIILKTYLNREIQFFDLYLQKFDLLFSV